MRRAALALTLLLAACTGAEIPRPDLTGAEAEVVEAVESAQKDVQENPRNAAAWGALGDRYRAGLWLEAAAAAYRHAARLEPAEFRWPYLIGHALSHHDLEGAAAALARAIEIDPRYTPARLLLAQRLARLGRADEARQQFEQAAGDPAYAAFAHTGLGQLALAAGEFQAARTHLERAVDLDPRQGEARRALAQVCLALGDEGAAAEQSRLAEALPYRTPFLDPRAVSGVAPAGSVAHVDAGKARMAEGKFEEAAREFRAALREDPDSAAAHYSLAIVLTRFEKYEEAARHLKELERIQPDSPHLANARAQWLAYQGRLEEAAAEWRRSLTRDAQNPQTHHGLGDTLLQLGRLEEAERELVESVRLDPSNAAAHDTLAEIRARRGR